MGDGVRIIAGTLRFDHAARRRHLRYQVRVRRAAQLIGREEAAVRQSRAAAARMDHAPDARFQAAPDLIEQVEQRGIV